MKTTRVCRSLLITGALAALVCVSPSFAVTDNPYIITGYETSRSNIITPEEIAENYRIVMNAEEDITPTVSNGLACVLQSSRNKYWSNDDIFLCLRFSAAEKHSRVVLDTRAVVTIRIVRADSGKEVVSGRYSETGRPVQKGSPGVYPALVEISGPAGESGWTELDFLLTRHDFRLSGLKKGFYRISMSYVSTSEAGWSGEITSPEVDIEVLE